MIQMHHATNSERSVFEACKHKHFIQSILGARATRLAKPLEMGRIWHDALEMWWRRWDVLTALQFPFKRARVGADDILGRGFEALRSRLPKGFTTSNRFGWMTAESLDESEALFAAMLQGYHERYKSQPLELVMNEEVLSCPVKTRRGNVSNRSGIAGRLDKLVRDEHGQLWVTDHKTTKMQLRDWRTTHEYNPQLSQYAVMLRRMGYDPVGVCYDLALKAAPPAPESFRVVAKGDRLYAQLPQHTDAASYRAALLHHGLDESEPSHVKALGRLDQLDDLFFKRVWIRFGDGEIDRAEREIYTTATQIRRAHDVCVHEKERLRSSPSMADWRARLVETAQRRGPDFPRSSGACYQYRRECSLMAFCKRPCATTALDLEPWERDYLATNGLVAPTKPDFNKGI